MSHFITDDTISNLPRNERLDGKDLFIVSHTDDAGETYSSRSVSYGAFLSCMSADFDIDGLKDGIARNRRNIDILSVGVTDLSADLADLSARFLSNDELTRKIPGLSSDIAELSAKQLRLQEIDRLIDLSTGISWLMFEPQDSAVNACIIGSHNADVALFRMPPSLSVGNPELSDLGRHMILDVSADSRCSVRLMGDCRYISDSDKVFDELSVGEHALFIFKEVRPDVMYVQRQEVLSAFRGMSPDKLVAAVYYNKLSDETYESWNTGVDVFQVSSGTMVSANAEMSALASAISSHVDESQTFHYMIDLANPDVKMTLDDYLGLCIVRDTLLSAHYGDNSVFTVYFLGNLQEDKRPKRIMSFFPVGQGENIYEQQRKAYDELTRHLSDYISADHYLIGWAEHNPDGGVYRYNISDDWWTPTDPSIDFPTEFHVITEKKDLELSTLIDPAGAEIEMEILNDMPLGDLPAEGDVYGTYLQLEVPEDDTGDLTAYYMLRIANGEGSPEDPDDPTTNDPDTLGTATVIKLDTCVYEAVQES